MHETGLSSSFAIHFNNLAMRSISLLLAVLFAASPVLAQDDMQSQRPDPENPQGENMATPPTWTVRFDHPGTATVGADTTADVWFVNMTPGWHITTGPAAIFYHPASTVEGSQRIESNIDFFDPGERLEAYGIFFGGQNLEGDDITYDYFLVRNSGEFIVKRWTGHETSAIHPWTPHEAVAVFGPETEGPVANKLAVEIHDEEVLFFVNDAEVVRLPRESVNTDGVLGLRLNHHVNVHVSTLSVSDL